MKTKTTLTADLQEEQFDDLTWVMSVLARMEEGDSDHAEWMLNTLATNGCSDVMRLAASAALSSVKLSTA